MMGKRIFALFVAVTFTLGVAAFAFGEATIQERTGKIASIVGNKLIIVQKDGKQVTVEAKSTRGLKVGDEVALKEVDQAGGKKGFVIIDGGKLQSPALKQGPEPHMKK